MSETAIMAIEGTALPAHLQGQTSTAAAGLVVASDSLPRISAKDAQFILRDGDKELKLPIGESISIVILAADPAEGLSKSYYATGFTDGSHEAPDCSSADGVLPDSWVSQPQHTDCTTCPQAQWGSGRDQQGAPTKGKRCSDRKNLIVARPDKLESTLFTLSVAPTSLKNLTRYAKELISHNVAPANVVTVIGFDPEKPKVLTFGFGGFLDAAQNATAEARSVSNDVQNHVTKAPDAPVAQIPAVTQPVVTSPPLVAHQVVGEPLAAAETPEPVLEPELNPEPAVELDSAGVAWDGTIHAGTKTKKMDGTWKARKGVAAAAPVVVAPPAEVVAPPNPTAGGPPADVSAILEAW